jgi:hypothetical protein
MKKRFFLLMISFLWILPLSADAAASSSVTQDTPCIDLHDPSYQFEPAIEGDVITHEFTIGNSGNAPLEILKIQSG